MSENKLPTPENLNENLTNNEQPPQQEQKKKRRIKNYEIVKRLGKGSYAYVYLAHLIGQPENLITIKVNPNFKNIQGHKIQIIFNKEEK